MSISSFVGGVPSGLPNPNSKIVWDPENPNQIVGTFIIDGTLHKKLQKLLKTIIRDYKKSKKEGKGIEGGLEDDDDDKKLSNNILKLSSSSGRHIEDKLLQTKFNIEQTIKNIEVLNKFVKDAFTNVYNTLDKCSDSDTYTQNNKAIHDKLNEEMQKQIKLLESLLHQVIKPTDKEIKEFLKTNKDFETLADILLPFDVDTSEASDKLAVAFTSLNKLQFASSKVEKALAEVNMKMDDYIKTTSLPELNNEFLKLLQEKGKSADLQKITAALSILRTNFRDRKDIQEYMKKEGKGPEGGAIKIDHLETVSSELGRVKGTETKTALFKNIKKSQNTMKELYSLFLKEFNSRFNNIKESIGNMTEKVDPSLNNNENFLLFVDAYQNLGEIDNKNIFPALIGIGEQMSAREIKENFVNTIKQLVSIVDNVNSSGDFKSIKDNLKSVLDLIDTFTDLITSSRTVKLNSKTGKAEGGAIFDNLNTISDENLMASTQAVTDTVSKIKFLGNVMKIKKNLSNLDGFYKESKKDYDELLGKTIGYKLSQIYEFHQNATKSIDDKTNGIGFLIQEYNDAIKISKKDAEIGVAATAGAGAADKAALIQSIKTAANITDSNSFIKAINMTNRANLAAEKQFVRDNMVDYAPFVNLTPIDPEFLKNLSQLQYEAREGLYKSMEAIDLYLINFTQAIASDPDAINSLDKILSSTQIITKYYTDKTGDNLKELFDMFTKVSNQAGINNGVSYVIDNKDIKKIFEKCKESLDGFSALKNILSAFFFIGDKFNSKSVKDSIHMSPNLIFKNLQKYIMISSFSNNMYNSNLLNVDFNQLGDRRTPDENHQDQTRYLQLFFSFIMNSVNVTNATHSPIPALITTGFVPTAPAADDSSVLPIFKNAVLLQSINKDSNIFAKDDENLKITMHAIVSKIFTTVGTYSLLKDPMNKGDLITNPSRMILGGASEVPVVDNKLVEHYIRLPLLVEFYRNIFDKGNEKFKDNQSGDQTEQIAYIPDINGVWSKLISIIFDKSKNLKFGVYDQANLHAIIYEINKIAKSFEGKTINECVDHLIYEINRRYGILKKADIEAYYKTIKSFEEGTYTIDENITGNTNFDTLNEDNDVDASAPSDKYKRSLASMNNNSNSRNMATDDFKLVEDFRTNIKNELDKVIMPANAPLYKSSFREYVKLTKNEIEHAVSNEKKLEIISRSISNSNDEHIDNSDHYILFHELITTPLALLHSQYKFIAGSIYTIHYHLAHLHTVVDATDYDTAKNTYDTAKNTFDTSLKADADIATFDAATKIYNVYEFVKVYDTSKFSPEFLGKIVDIDETVVNNVNTGLNNLVSKVLELIFNLKSINSDLVKMEMINIKFLTNGSLMIDYSNYQNVVEQMIENIKSNIQKFRNVISKTILDKHTLLTNIGSIYYLEDKFLNKCLKNKQNELSNADDRYLLNFDSLTVPLKNIIQYVQPNPTNTLRTYNTNDTMVYGMLIRNKDVRTANITRVADIQLYRDMFRKYDGQKKSWVPLDYFGVSKLTIMPTITDWAAQNDSGILVMFNRLLQSYLTTFYDGTTKKIYQNLITTLTNNSLANITESGSGFVDLAIVNIAPAAAALRGVRGVVAAPAAVQAPDFNTTVLPANNVVISASLGFVLKTLLTRALNPTTPDSKFHLLTELSQVSPHFLEVMKSNLPVFIQLFTNLVKKALYYRRILLDNGFVQAAAAVGDINDDEFTIDDDIKIKASGWDEVTDMIDRTQRYRTILDNIVECATDIITDATNVLNELNTLDNNKVPFFMDIKKDFIRNYQNITKNIPFTPISQISTTFKTVATWDTDLATTLPLSNTEFTKRFNELIPTSISSSYDFKFQHGIRPLYSNNALSLENTLYMKELIKSYNSSLTSVNTIDNEKVNETLALFTTLSKMNISNILKTFETTIENIIITDVAVSSNPTYQISIDVLPLPPAMNQIMFTIQDTIVENSKKVVSKYVSASTNIVVSGLDNRDSARILNIIDLNIVPINIHALMREIPLINIYNYSYSLKAYLDKLRAPGGINIGLLDFIQNPYEYNHIYNGALDQLVNTTNAATGAKYVTALNHLHTETSQLNLSTPRFLNDQVWPKILLNANDAVNPIADLGINNNDARRLNAIAKTRYDTKLVRNLTFITQLQRIIRVQIRNKLQTINTRVISDAKILSEQYTEFSGTHQTYDDNEFTYNN
jgi:hypothetical protein